jgi:hypothetical protein
VGVETRGSRIYGGSTRVFRVYSSGSTRFIEHAVLIGDCAHAASGFSTPEPFFNEEQTKAARSYPAQLI